MATKPAPNSPPEVNVTYKAFPVEVMVLEGREVNVTNNDVDVPETS